MSRLLKKTNSAMTRFARAFILSICVGLFAFVLSNLFPHNSVFAGFTNPQPVSASSLKVGASAQTASTFGETAILPNDDSGNGNLLVAQQVVLSQDATLQSLSFYITTSVGRLVLGIYADAGGSPGALLAQTAIFTPVVGWNTQNVLSSVNLFAGTYWLAFLPESNSLHFRLGNSGAARWTRVQFGALPASFKASPQSGVYHWSFYGTVLLNATPTSTPVPTPTATSTLPPAPTLTSTSAPAPTATGTQPPAPTATNTSLPVNSPTPTATLTSIPPSSPTPTATSTSLPAPTATPTGSAVGLAFAPKIDFTVGTGPTHVAVGDLDGDGKPDLAVANYGISTAIGNTISVLKNTSTNGNITFAAKIDFPTGAGPHGIVMSDLDGDGKLDVVVTQYGANGSGNWIAVLRNISTLGSISLAGRQDYAAGTGPHNVAIGDLDGDGKPDLAVTNFADGTGSTVTVLRNTSTVGSISFAPAQTYTVGTGPYGIAAGDLNGDGKIDIVVGDTGSISGSGTTISVLQNTSPAPGSISFSPKVDFQANSGPREVILRDMDRDGRLDVAVANFGNYDGTTLSVFRNTSSNGILSLAPKVDLLVGPAPHGLAGGDFDGNGLPDIAVTNYGTGNGMSISVLQNNSTSGNINFAPRLDLATNAGPHGAAVGDLDGDGATDIVVANYGTGNGNTISVLRNLTSQPPVGNPTSTPLPTSTPTATPINNPLPSSTPTPTATSIPLPSSTPTATATSMPMPSSTPTATPVALPTATPTAGSGLVFSPKIDFTVGSGPTSSVVGDLDGDGKPDVAVANYGTSSSIGNTVSVLRNTSSIGSVTFAPKADFSVGSGPHGIALGDLDGDGKPDLVVTQYGANGSGNSVTVLRNTSSPGSITFAAGMTFSVGTGPLGVAIGDLNGDGKPDLAVTNFADGSGATIAVLSNTSTAGNISFAAAQPFPVAAGPYGIAIGDLDGDGKPDVVIGNNGSLSGSGTTISVLLNTSTASSITFAARLDFQTNSGPRQVILRDLDGDARLDVAVGNFGNYDGATVSVFRNTSIVGNIAFAARVDLSAGPAPHGLEAGDFNGDGKPDLAATNFGSGNGTSVSVLQNNSTSGNINFASRLDLATNAGPIGAAVGDLDGDGRLDIVVTNYGTGNGNTISVLRNQS